MSTGQKTLESMSQAIWYNQWTLKKFATFLKGDILEVGCGIGNFTYSLINYGNVYAIDISKEYVDKTKSLVNGKASVGLGDIESGKYFFVKKEFDCIVCLNVLEHIKVDEAALKNIYDLLKPGGKLVLLVPVHSFLYSKIDKLLGHFKRYNKQEIKTMLNQVGFKILKIRLLNLLGAVGWFISGKILGHQYIDSSKIKIFNLVAPIALNIENIIEPPIGTSVLVVAEKKFR